MLQLLSPAGSMEALTAAVQNGADAVYLGLGDFNARKNAKNFTDEEFAQAVRYCHIRGVKVYVALNTLITDRELEDAAKLIEKINASGADAVIVQDLGAAAMIRTLAPELPIHGSTQMSVHSLDGVKVCAAMGMTRVVVARELSFAQLKYICQKSPIEIEVFVHGALCMCYSGQCYMSSVIGRRSGNRGLCAQPCRLEYGFGDKADGHPLSLKDNCLATYLRELEAIGVTCLKIEGRMKRPEYVAITADVYSRAIRSGAVPTNAELSRLRAAFSRQGFTDGYFTGSKGPKMFGIREEGGEKETQKLFAAARATYTKGEKQRAPVWFIAALKENEPFSLAVYDNEGHVRSVRGLIPEKARTFSVTQESLSAQLEKCGGTPYYCAGVRATVDEGLSLSLAAVNVSRREVLAALTEARGEVKPRPFEPYTEGYKLVNGKKEPELTVSVSRADQITADLISVAPKVLYVPLHVAAENPKAMRLIFSNPGITPVVSLPRIITDDEMKKTGELLGAAYSIGFRQALIGNLGHIGLARARGFALRGDFGLNIYNSMSLDVLAKMGVLSAAVSFELSLSQIRDLSKSLDTELIAYGRLPLMVTENCVFKNRDGACACEEKPSLVDRTGARFPLARDGDACRTVILNSQVLYLGDKYDDYARLGLWAVRLAFTDESPRELMNVIRSYVAQEKRAPGSFTRGLYFRGTV